MGYLAFRKLLVLAVGAQPGERLKSALGLDARALAAAYFDRKTRSHTVTR